MHRHTVEQIISKPKTAQQLIAQGQVMWVFLLDNSGP